MTVTVAIAPVRKQIRIAASQAHCFDVFVNRLDRWWPRRASVGAAPMARARFEPREGGRWYEEDAEGNQTAWGRIKLWDPPNRLIVSWEINQHFKPDSTVASEVEVRFTSTGDGATIVELEHRNFESMGAEDGASLREKVDGGWPGILDEFRNAAESKHNP